MLMAPVLGKDIRGIGFARDVEETEDTGSNGFTNSVEGEGGVSLVEFGMGNGATVNYGLVVTKHISVAHGNAHVPECGTEVQNLLSGSAGSTELRAVGGGFYSVLFLAVPVDEAIVEEVNNASD